MTYHDAAGRPNAQPGECSCPQGRGSRFGSSPFVSVIIPSRHNWHGLQYCLGALNAQSYSHDAFEILIVNNDPTDPPPDIHFPANARILHEAKKGSFAARNRGLSEAQGEVVAFTDADCMPDPYWLERAVTRLETGADRVAGRVELSYQSDRLTWAEGYECLFAFDQRSYVSQGKAVTANLITWRWAFDRIGPFDPELLSGGDMEWGERATAAGLGIVYVPSAKVRHPARATFRELADKRRRISRSHRMLDQHRKAHLSLFILTGLVPPGRAIMRVLRRPEIRLSAKLPVSAIVYGLQLVQISDTARLLLGDRTRRLKRRFLE